MNIVFLFNSDHPSLGSYYGPPVRDRILGARVLQKAERHMRVSLGDVLTYGAIARSPTRTYKALIELCNAVYRPRDLDLLIRSRLEPTYDRATVYCWLFQNMTQAIAEELHAKLLPDPAFLGTMDVSFSDPLHLRFFRNSLCEEYRLQGRRCSVFYSMGENEGPDIGVQDGFEKHGFNVSYEDSGARRTIFDDYDTIEHFRRVEDFKRTFAEFSHVDADIASDLALNLEELHPKLFDAFAAAARTLARAETEEDYAQAALSGRRVLERIADYLSPPREELWNGRMVGSNQYKNRLWAYIEKAVSANDSAGKLNRLGKEADKLVALFNSGLHAEPTKEKVEGAFSTLGLWLTEVIELSPESARQPYLAYDQQLRDFVNDIL